MRPTLGVAGPAIRVGAPSGEETACCAWRLVGARQRLRKITDGSANSLFSVSQVILDMGEGMRSTDAEHMSTSIPTDQAWRTFGDWKSSGREIGVIFYGCSGNSLYTMGFVESAPHDPLPFEHRP